MAADSFSNVSLTPMAWVNESSQRESAQDSDTNKKARTPAKTMRKQTDHLEFEATEHELDSIA